MSQPPQQPPAGGSVPGPTGWADAPSPSWAPAWTPPGSAVPPQAFPPAFPPAVPPPAPAGGKGAGRPKVVLLVAAAAAGLLVGIIASGLLVVALFSAAAEDVGREMAGEIGDAVERGIVDGSTEAVEDSMDQLLESYGAFGDPYGGGLATGEEFPPVPPEVPGPDPVLDGYSQECFEGDLQSCDDLLYESPPLSDYEEYASTCGGRVKPYTVYACTELE